MISTNDFLTPKGTRKSASNPFPNTPIIKIDSAEGNKRVGFTVNRKAGEVLDLAKEEGSNVKFSGNEYLAFVAKDDSLFVTVIDEETANANKGNFCRIGKSGAGNSKAAWAEATSVASINGGENLIVNKTDSPGVFELSVYLGDVADAAELEEAQETPEETEQEEVAEEVVEETSDFDGF